jgi:hypothetical protein
LQLQARSCWCEVRRDMPRAASESLCTQVIVVSATLVTFLLVTSAALVCPVAPVCVQEILLVGGMGAVVRNLRCEPMMQRHNERAE